MKKLWLLVLAFALLPMVWAGNETIWDYTRPGYEHAASGGAIWKCRLMVNGTNNTATKVRLVVQAGSGTLEFQTGSMLGEAISNDITQSTNSVNITWNGSKTMTTCSGCKAWSDWVTFTWDNDKNYTFAWDSGNTYQAHSNQQIPQMSIQHWAIQDSELMFKEDWRGVGNLANQTTANCPVIAVEGVIEEGDSTIPTYSGLTSNASDTRYESDVLWEVVMEDEVNLSSYTFSFNESGSWANDSVVLIGADHHHANITKSLTEQAGTYVCGKFHFNDSSGNENVTTDNCFTINNSGPGWSSHSHNATFDSGEGSTVQFSVDLTDDFNLSHGIFYNNCTNLNSSGTVTGTSETYTDQLASMTCEKNDYVCGKFFFNDSYGAWNETNNTCFFVGNARPSPDFAASFTNYSEGHGFNVTAGVTDVDGFADIVTLNISVSSGACEQKLNSTSGDIFNATFNCSGAALAAATINIGFTDINGSYASIEGQNAYPNADPTINTQAVFENVTAMHRFNVTVGAKDGDGASEIVATNISVTSGVCMNLYNSSAEMIFNATYNCTGSSLAAATVVVGFTDASGGYVSSTADENTYPNTVPGQVTSWTTPASDPDHDNTNITFSWGAATDDDGDTVTYTFWLNYTNVSSSTSTTWASNFTREGNYSYVVGTFDGQEWGSNSTERWLEMDYTKPAITVTAPANLTVFNPRDDNVTYTLSGTDSNPYILNYTFESPTGSLLESAQNSTPDGNELSLSGVLDISGQSSGTYYLNVTMSDSHTAKVWEPDVTITTKTGSLDFDFPGEKISVGFSSAADVTVSAVKDVDRYNFQLSSSKTLRDVTFTVTADKIVPVTSQYHGHLVLNDRYWFDIEPYEAQSISIEGNTATIVGVNPKVAEEVVVKSIGGLNIETEIVHVIVDADGPTNDGVVNNESSAGVDDDVLWQVNVTDTNNISVYVASDNESGNWTNQSAVLVDGPSYFINYTVTLDNVTDGDRVCVKFYYNDSVDNWASTSDSCFTLGDSAPTFDEDLVDQSVTNEETLSYDVNCSDSGGDSITYFDNTTLFDINSGSGLITYRGNNPYDIAHIYAIVITCSDNTSNTTQSFNLTVRPSARGGGDGGAAGSWDPPDNPDTCEMYGPGFEMGDDGWCVPTDPEATSGGSTGPETLSEWVSYYWDKIKSAVQKPLLTITSDTEPTEDSSEQQIGSAESEVNKVPSVIVGILLALAITIGVAWVSKFVPRIVLDIAGLVTMVFLLVLWFQLLGVDSSAVGDLFDKIKVLAWVVPLTAGIALGNMVRKWIGL